MTSTAELTLAAQLEQADIPFGTEVSVTPSRKFRFDFIVGEDLGTATLLVEIDGGAWINGRHSRGAGMEADCEKSALAAIAGCRVMRVTPAQVDDGRALAWIERALLLGARR